MQTDKKNTLSPVKDITLQIYLRPHLAAWLRTRWGNPVRFPVRSYENMLLHFLVTRGRCAPCPLSPPEAEKERVSIVLTDCAHRRPEYYHHLTRRASLDFARELERQFRLQLWQECSPLLLQRSGLNSGLERWCQRQGIKVEHREGVRQKFYRMRKIYDADRENEPKRSHYSGKK